MALLAFFLIALWTSAVIPAITPTVPIVDIVDEKVAENPQEQQISTTSTTNELLKVTVIVIGYNRLDGMKRLLSSLEQTTLLEERLHIHLHICLDGGADMEVYEYASHYTANGKKFNEYSVLRREHNYGLAKHITACWKDPEEGTWALFLEDDVVVTPPLFTAFWHGVNIANSNDHDHQIHGIAMHGQRVNQYCWKNFVQRQNCPTIAEKCQTINASDSQLGALMCMPPTSSAWMTTQIPSSWGAFYTAHSWRTFQEYFELWWQLSPAQTSSVLGLPMSMSNEWTKSWKRPFAELFHALGWTLLYRNKPEQASIAITTRGAGVHTKVNATKYEQMSKCLIELPHDYHVESSSSNTASSVKQLQHYDYCSYPLDNLQVLQERGTALVQRLDQLYNSSHHHPLQPIVQLLTRESPTPATSQTAATTTALIPAHGTVPRLAADIILVTTAHAVNREFQQFCKQLKAFGETGRVHVLIVGPPAICIYLRNYETVTCLPEADFVNDKLPVITKMLQGGLEAAIPGVTKFVGVLNSDVVFEKGQLEHTIDLVQNQAICTPPQNCVLAGQRTDVDWDTKEEKLHSSYGMDYFLFNIGGAQLAVDIMPPLVVGRIRWDSYFMGKFVISDDIKVIDATATLTTKHYMEFDNAFASKSHADLTNHHLAKEEYRMGRVDFSNFRINAETTKVEPLLSTRDQKRDFHFHRERFQFDLFVEESTNFTYSPAGLFPYTHCWCALMEPSQRPKQYCSSSSLLAYNIRRNGKHRYLLILSHDSLLSPPQNSNIQFEEVIINHLANTTVDKCCYYSYEADFKKRKNLFSMAARPRSAMFQMRKEYTKPFSVQCLKEDPTFPFGIY